MSKINTLTVSADKVMEAAKNCPDAAKVLKTLFPEVFAAETKDRRALTIAAGGIVRSVAAEALFHDGHPLREKVYLVTEVDTPPFDKMGQVLWLHASLNPYLFKEDDTDSHFTVQFSIPTGFRGRDVDTSHLFQEDKYSLNEKIQIRHGGRAAGKGLWLRAYVGDGIPVLQATLGQNWLITWVKR